MKNVKFHTIENELYYKGEIIVRYSIEYEEILNKEMRPINNENIKIVSSLKQFIETEIYEMAKQCYEYHKKVGKPTMVYELIQEVKHLY